jgi:hypothetical protein
VAQWLNPGYYDFIKILAIGIWILFEI